MLFQCVNKAIFQFNWICKQFLYLSLHNFWKSFNGQKIKCLVIENIINWTIIDISLTVLDMI